MGNHEYRNIAHHKKGHAAHTLLLSFEDLWWTPARIVLTRERFSINVVFSICFGVDV